jgi:heavy metal sensor kinase
MTLTARLSTFFLGALAVVLIGFAVTLYLLARSYFYRQLHERLGAALNTLVAAVEIEPDGLDWEPWERRLTVGHDTEDNQVLWLLRAGDGRIVDHCQKLFAKDPLFEVPLVPSGTDVASCALEMRGEDWRVLQQKIQSNSTAIARVSMSKPSDVPQPTQPQPRQKHAALIVTVAMSSGPVEATLGKLALVLVALSAGLWTGSALLGRWLCRRALAPMTAMAATARAMSEADWDERLPLSETHDELEDLGRAFNGLLARLQEAFERQRRFTGDASHQLRTPLTAMLGQIEVILRRDRSTEEYREALERMQGQSVRLHQMVEMLLFLARADRDAKQPDLEEVDLASWVDRHLQSWSDHPRAADLHLEQTLHCPLFVRVQPPLLGQLLDNLLDNACKYSQAGTPITLRLGRQTGNVICTVEDCGGGIPEADLPHIFEPFYRSEMVRRQGYPGVGLGLTVAERIAAVFGGTLAAESEPEQGCRFTLRLPEVKVMTEPVASQSCLA